eukprot:TRINITY_DN21650_c0_g1_i1.p1 TRINITY_DN21650_c0_g1~~TRINITY_DN21650_c0_g1_i1.p1  ORF type:complete len:135 (+),score=16.02 TRINITY_DN21650_c0_g1_i1:38-442(+)
MQAERKARIDDDGKSIGTVSESGTEDTHTTQDHSSTTWYSLESLPGENRCDVAVEKREVLLPQPKNNPKANAYAHMLSRYYKPAIQANDKRAHEDVQLLQQIFQAKAQPAEQPAPSAARGARAGSMSSIDTFSE